MFVRSDPRTYATCQTKTNTILKPRPLLIKLRCVEFQNNIFVTESMQLSTVQNSPQRYHRPYFQNLHVEKSSYHFETLVGEWMLY